MTWVPQPDRTLLIQRAKLFQNIRQFFQQRGVLEVDTAALAPYTVTDPHIHSFHTYFSNPQGQNHQKLYLQTSPEYAMKKLLAAGVGSIYQLGKVFRNGEYGQRHYPEFTMLEWYRVEFDHHQLMQEVDALFRVVANQPPAIKISYQRLFETHLQINPHTASVADLREVALKHRIEDLFSTEEAMRSQWLDLLMSHCIEPKLGFQAPLFVYDFPTCQAALARIRHEDPPVAERFEVFIQGMELANGFHELTDPAEQKQRFQKDQATRRTLNYPVPAIDLSFLEALSHGLPNCAGVSLGIDRLLMIMTGKKHLSEVITSPLINLS